ncbi:PH domain-containing protein [Streptomyces sp. CA-111067]|uniref:PH domain-containing protein n=1 Tax=Streptomyces sp. CA-111067 TaxID=3240046 RepID=UPI003D95480F
MYVEREFLGRDRYRISWPNATGALAFVALEMVVTLLRLGFVGSCWVAAGTVVLISLILVVLRRSRTAVGAEGISISWGFGRGRTYPWADIRWVEVRETQSRTGRAQTVRITLADSRRRSLPAVQNSTMYPDRDFELNVARIMTRWRANTTEESRYRPPEKRYQRLSPNAWGYIIGGVILVVVLLVTVIAILVTG